MLIKLNVREQVYKGIDVFLQKYTEKFKYCVYEENYIFKLKPTLIYCFLQDLYSFVNNEDNQIKSNLLFYPIEFVVSFKGLILHVSLYDTYRE